MSVRDIIQAAAGVGGSTTSIDIDDYNFTANYGDSYSGGYDIVLNSTGTRMWLVSSYVSGALSNPAVIEYSLSTAYNLSTGSQASTFTPTWSDSYPTVAMSFGSNGNYLFNYSYNDDKIYRNPLGTAYLIGTASTYDQTLEGPLISTAGGFTMSADGTKVFITRRGKIVYVATLSTANDLSTAGSFTEFDLTSYIPTGGLYGIKFISIDEIHYCVLGTRTTDIVYFLQLSTAEDLSSIVDSQSRNFAYSSFGVGISSDGNELFLGEGSSNVGDVVRFSL